MSGDASMTEARDNDTPAASATPASAGSMLRAAREASGLHIAALAAAIKVSPRKLEALEADRHGDLPDMTFTRALAQTVCRALKVDAEPVLAMLPQAGDMPRLAQVGAGLNAPFRESPGSRDPGDHTLLRRPMFWATLAVLLAAVVLALMPEQWMPWRTATAPARMAAPAVPAPGPVAAPAVALPAAVTPSASAPVPAQVETVHSAPLPVAGAAAASGVVGGLLVVRTSAASWIEVQDGRGQTLLSRTVQAGEAVGLDGPLPLRVAIGNAAATQITFRNEEVDLAASTRDNVARLQLQ